VALPLSIEGKYKVLAKLSEGGMGAVYKVRHTLLDEIRVVKVILPHLGHTEELSDRFLREARAASRLRHANIAQILDFTVDEQGHELLVMEFIDGLTVKEILQRTGPPPLGLAVEIARQALAALGYLHRRGFVHRDISPDNLMLSRDADGRPLVKLIDLGIAKAIASDLGRDLDDSLTRTGIFLGKPRYASPEQLEDRGPIDARSDLYSFGIVLYELLTGRCPITGRSAQELMAAHLLRPPLPFDETDPQGRVPPGLREIVLRMLAKKPDQRIATAEELSDALAPFAAPWTTADLAAILPRPSEETAPHARPRSEPTPDPSTWADGLAPSVAAAAHVTRRTAQPTPAPSPPRRSGYTTVPEKPSPLTPPPRSAPPSPPPPPPLLEPELESFEPRKRSRGLAAAGLITGALALGALGLWIAGPRGPAEPKTRQATPPPLHQETPPAATTAPAEPSPSPLLGTDLTPPAETPQTPPAAQGFVKAQPLDPPRATYPDPARGTGLAVRVTVDLDISESGRVLSANAPFLASAKPIPQNLYLLFKDAALQAARGTRFQPATRDGAPVEDKVRLVVEVREESRE
jgi:serine/threonine-protein kinase